MPHEINYAANIWALKSVGVRQVVGVSAVGSLREEIKPGDFAIASQYFDWAKGQRRKSFFGEGLAAHISTAETTCVSTTKALKEVADELGFVLHTDKTYACVDGPRLGTRAESHFLRESAKCDLVGMTNVPEVFLAREAQMTYCTIGVVTDYDCWLDDPSMHVSVGQIISRYGESIENAKALIKSFLSKPLPEIDSIYRESLRDAVLTPVDVLSDEKKELLSLLKE